MCLYFDMTRTLHWINIIRLFEYKSLKSLQMLFMELRCWDPGHTAPSSPWPKAEFIHAWLAALKHALDYCILLCHYICQYCVAHVFPGCSVVISLGHFGLAALASSLAFAFARLCHCLLGCREELELDDDDDDDAVDELGLAAEAAEAAEACHCIFLSSNSEVLLKLPSCTKARSKNSLPCSATSLLSVKIRILWWASLSPSLALAAADSASFCLFFALAAADSASFCLSFALAAATSASFSLSFALAASALASFSCRSWWRACRLLRWALEFWRACGIWNFAIEVARYTQKYFQSAVIQDIFKVACVMQGNIVAVIVCCLHNLSYLVLASLSQPYLLQNIISHFFQRFA